MKDKSRKHLSQFFGRVLFVVRAGLFVISKEGSMEVEKEDVK
ncbi:hypothetical protein BLGI_990 [Brevibacillus laterosporus GI-9]|nr:hypothetical protein BLGI_990 [Brevibacillus laterosporus GI-9]